MGVNANLVRRSDEGRRLTTSEVEQRPRSTSGSARPREVGLALLDGFELRAAGERVELPASAQRLLAFLALQRRAVQRIYIAGILWTDSSEERSLANLRSTLWRLRRPGRPVVSAHGGLLQLRSEVSVDVEKVTRLAHDVLAGRIECAQPEIEQLSHGDLLPDWYEDWVLMERERLRHLRLHALEALCAQLAEAGRHWCAIEAGLAAVRADPLRESAHRALIAAHLAEGNAAEALHHYRWFCALLRRELGLTPSPDLQRLLRGLPRPRASRPVPPKAGDGAGARTAKQSERALTDPR